MANVWQLQQQQWVDMTTVAVGCDLRARDPTIKQHWQRKNCYIVTTLWPCLACCLQPLQATLQLQLGLRCRKP